MVHLRKEFSAIKEGLYIRGEASSITRKAGAVTVLAGVVGDALRYSSFSTPMVKICSSPAGSTLTILAQKGASGF